MHEAYSATPHIPSRRDAFLSTGITLLVHIKHVLMFEEFQDYRITFVCVYF
jgi:hypothetical protein